MNSGDIDPPVTWILTQISTLPSTWRLTILFNRTALRKTPSTLSITHGCSRTLSRLVTLNQKYLLQEQYLISILIYLIVASNVSWQRCINHQSITCTVVSRLTLVVNHTHQSLDQMYIQLGGQYGSLFTGSSTDLVVKK